MRQRASRRNSCPAAVPGFFVPYRSNNRDDEAASVVSGDIDNDGDIDLYITNIGVFFPPMGPAPGSIFNVPGLNRLMLNQGHSNNGKWLGFVEAPAGAMAGGNPFTRSQQPSFVDFDRDGDLDIYIAAHNHIVLPFFRSDIRDCLPGEAEAVGSLRP